MCMYSLVGIKDVSVYCCIYFTLFVRPRACMWETRRVPTCVGVNHSCRRERRRTFKNNIGVHVLCSRNVHPTRLYVQRSIVLWCRTCISWYSWHPLCKYRAKNANIPLTENLTSYDSSLYVAREWRTISPIFCEGAKEIDHLQFPAVPTCRNALHSKTCCLNIVKNSSVRTQ